MKKFTLVIYASPAAQSSGTALEYARAVLASGHDIFRLFFFQDGVFNACSFSVAPQDETDLPAAWQSLITEHDIDAVVCAASALRRGILDENEAERYDKDAANLLPGFELSGLGQLVDACLKSDRIINFLP